jgi:hypothetical protein
MLASASEVLGMVVVFAFVAFTIGFVLYALIRPFTHTHYEHQTGLWTHLP